MSRLRSESKYPSRMVISCNPDPDHYLRTMIDWYLDEEGYPRPEADGVVRWFITRDGTYHWADTKEELHERFDTPTSKCLPLSFSFISATIHDNPPMLLNNKEYLAFLEGLNEIDKARLLYGNWNVRPKDSTLFSWDWLKTAEHLPYGCKTVRGYDLAGTVPSDVNPTPDFTASIQISRCSNGYFYLSGNYHNLFCDEALDVRGVMRKLSGERNQIMLKQAHEDGSDIHIILPQDPNSAGKSVFEDMVKFFMSEGFLVHKDPVSHTASKISRFEQFATAASNGLVYIVPSTFDVRTLEHIKKNITSFNGERSGRTYKDDIADCTATAFNYLNKVQVIPKITLPSLTKTNEFNF